MIFGVTGLYGSGKDTVAEMLVEKNFYHFSLSDILRDEMRKRKIPITRDNLISSANKIRAEYGADYFARKALKNIRCGENHVITSIRSVDEAKAILEQENAIIINVVAPDKERLRRLVARDRESDPKTLEELHRKEKKEMSNDKAGQHLHKVSAMAKVTIRNDSTRAALQKKIDKLVQDYLYVLQPSRPSWDDYFMGVAEIIKLRCTCMSAKKGAVIVRDKRIISTGYNGSPKGIKHCTDGGCKRCTLRHLGKMKSGVYAEPCICAHSEENAIVQAAVNGISTKGAVIYTTFTPCVNCAKMIINAEIKEVIAKVLYPDDDAMQLFKEAGIKVRLYKPAKNK
ncbi:AAA family ATPase [Candidatus Woesearchaeota archaeon]|nr:AAA family ATPase [Candidatus Woesearchaeota archaeon]